MKTKKKLKFNHFQALFCVGMVDCCYNKQVKQKIKIFDRGMKMLKEKLNITNLIKAYLDIEKLKYILMSSDQLVLFELIKNPKLVVGPENSKKVDSLRDYLLNKDNIKKYERQEIDQFFERVLKENDPISKKILSVHSEHHI